jgi:hypothetical protein
MVSKYETLVGPTWVDAWVPKQCWREGLEKGGGNWAFY